MYQINSVCSSSNSYGISETTISLVLRFLAITYTVVFCENKKFSISLLQSLSSKIDVKYNEVPAKLFLSLIKSLLFGFVSSLSIFSEIEFLYISEECSVSTDAVVYFGNPDTRLS